MSSCCTTSKLPNDGMNCSTWAGTLNCDQLSEYALILDGSFEIERREHVISMWFWLHDFLTYLSKRYVNVVTGLCEYDVRGTLG